MVRNRVQEALRVSALPGWSATAPVFVYMRPVFVDDNKRFLSQVTKTNLNVDLFNTLSIGTLRNSLQHDFLTWLGCSWEAFANDKH